jgi:hypothetical protein
MDPRIMTSHLRPDRYQAVSRDVHGYFDSTGMAADFDVDAIIADVAARANALDDLTEADFNGILQQHERSS